MTWFYVWRCRRCGECERNPGGARELVQQTFAHLVACGGEIPTGARVTDLVQPRSLIDDHRCADGGVGVSDLIGIESDRSDVEWVGSEREPEHVARAVRDAVGPRYIVSAERCGPESSDDVTPRGLLVVVRWIDDLEASHSYEQWFPDSASLQPCVEKLVRNVASARRPRA